MDMAALKSEEDTRGSSEIQRATSTETSTENAVTNPNEMHGFKLFAIFVGICFGAFLMSLDIFVIATVLLPIPAAFFRRMILSDY